MIDRRRGATGVTRRAVMVDSNSKSESPAADSESDRNLNAAGQRNFNLKFNNLHFYELTGTRSVSAFVCVCVQ